jgi:hypothetical protein
VRALPTAFGPLTMAAKRTGDQLDITLGDGLTETVPMQLIWPNRTRPTSVRVDGRAVDDFDARGVRLSKPFRTLEARW